MAKIGYMMLTADGKDVAKDKKWMEDFGCVVIAQDAAHDELHRPVWRELLKKVKAGDVIVVPRISEIIRGLNDISTVFQFCTMKQLRLVAFHDKFDSEDEIFPARTTAEWMSFLSALPDKILMFREENTHIESLRALRKFQDTKGRKMMSTAERDSLIINMYQMGMNMPDIMSSVGILTRATIYRILKKNGIQLDRRAPNKFAASGGVEAEVESSEE